jgi:hypothetical protein
VSITVSHGTAPLRELVTAFAGPDQAASKIHLWRPSSLLYVSTVTYPHI